MPPYHGQMVQLHSNVPDVPVTRRMTPRLCQASLSHRNFPDALQRALVSLPASPVIYGGVT